MYENNKKISFNLKYECMYVRIPGWSDRSCEEWGHNHDVMHGDVGVG